MASRPHPQPAGKQDVHGRAPVWEAQQESESGDHFPPRNADYQRGDLAESAEDPDRQCPIQQTEFAASVPAPWAGEMWALRIDLHRVCDSSPERQRGVLLPL